MASYSYVTFAVKTTFHFFYCGITICHTENTCSKKILQAPKKTTIDKKSASQERNLSVDYHYQ